MNIASNFLLQFTLNTVLAELRTPSTVRLYTNPAPPQPSWPISYFSEATFTGYAPELWIDPLAPGTIKILDGWYETVGHQYRFFCTGNPPQQIYGAYVTTGPILWFSQPLPEPLVMSLGDELRITLSLASLAQSLCAG